VTENHFGLKIRNPFLKFKANLGKKSDGVYRPIMASASVDGDAGCLLGGDAFEFEEYAGFR
jgi:hypothetical protein